MSKLKPKDKYEIDDYVRVPQVKGTMTYRTCHGKITNLLPTVNGEIIAYVEITYGNNYVGYWPFYTYELNRKICR